ncbi:MAG: hypothetical protein AAF810_03840 [Cyanobacteria bacterium P01_D01_bin.36]
MTFSTTNQSNLSSTHTANLLEKLSHRLDVAKAHQNLSLVAALEAEYAQLTETASATAVTYATLSHRLQRLWMSFAETLSEWTKVQIEETVNANGQHSWYAYNPQSGQAVFTESKVEMQQWVKKNYWEQ